MKDKNDAYDNFIDMIKNAWTWDKMTPEERSRCISAFTITRQFIKGSYSARWEMMHAIYEAFLIGIGCTSWDWRREEA